MLALSGWHSSWKEFTEIIWFEHCSIVNRGIICFPYWSILNLTYGYIGLVWEFHAPSNGLLFKVKSAFESNEEEDGKKIRKW